ncbi:uncharacterized protein M421DRAFT_159192 [Didymella exigua CBS 183.55]|uniref:Uncharacterized protein n=1 Tax=Didymella exigua CBS 183.55 TaxID=1150837 RepID=A0A6A5RJ01_9PLEO|nr:uncharacterized protein M421DRAFT_159192 [Didymella exigua CBS 183.55]KAF1928355.1 hypothetical protein M421DRAFT_159192 [Didymella exigua CBS 183.55]
MMYSPPPPVYLGKDPEWPFGALASSSSGIVSLDLNDLRPQEFRTSRGSSHAYDSDDETAESTLGSDSGECLERRMIEDFGGDDEVAHARSSTSGLYTPTSRSDDQELR